jgi:hypothetical protein
METTSDDNKRANEGGHGVLLIVAWLWVGIPLLWGVYQTLIKSLPLFKL